MHNIEAEQALLGALLLNNDVLDRVADLVSPADFYEPLHGRIYAAARDLISAGRLATPVTLRQPFGDDAAMADLGGPVYLARLAGSAVSIANARDYADIVGEMSARRSLAVALQSAADALQSSPAGQVAHDAMQALDGALRGRESQPLTVSWAAAVKRMMDDVSAAYQGDGTPGVQTGLTALDEAIGGMFPGDLLLLGARPSMGKTALALALALNVARQGHGVLFCSLEMQTEGIAIRAVAEHMRRQGVSLPYSRARLGRMSEDEMRSFVYAAADLQKLPIMLTPPSIRDVGKLRLSIRRAAKSLAARNAPLKLIVFDYIQLSEAAGDSANERVSAISKSLKSAAIEHGVPVLALSQLSRQVESRDDKRPIMSDLRDSGTLEQDADVVMFAYRDEYYLERMKPPSDDKKLLAWGDALDKARGYMDVIIAKQRNGSLKTVPLRFDAATNSVSDDQEAML